MRALRTTLLTLTFLALTAPAALAASGHDGGEGIYGETDDKVVTNAGFFLIAFFPTLILVLQGQRSVAPDLLAISHAYDASTADLLRRVRLPSALPKTVSRSRRPLLPDSPPSSFLSEDRRRGGDAACQCQRGPPGTP